MGGIAVGVNTFDREAAIEAMNKADKPTTEAAEALAMRVATRALCWGTLLAISSAFASVACARFIFHIESTDDLRRRLKSSLGPVHEQLHTKGEALETMGIYLQSLGRRAGRWLGVKDGRRAEPDEK